MDQIEFLGHVIGPEEGLVCLAKVGPDGGMLRKWVEYPPSEPYTDQEWPYFLPALFDEEEGSGRTRVIAVNVDEIENLPRQMTPSLTVNTSQIRVVAYYILNEWISFEESRALAQRVAPSADPSAYMRLPGLTNEKYAKKFIVEITRAPLMEYQLGIFRNLPETAGTVLQPLADWTWEPAGIGPKEYLQTLAAAERIPKRLLSLVGSGTGGGFNAVLSVVSGLELPDEEKVYILRNAVSNPYRQLKEVGRETAKAYARYAAQNGSLIDPLILELERARKNRTGAAFLRKQHVSDIAYRELSASGTFVHSVDDQAYYIEESTGQAIQLSAHSEKFKHLLVRKLKINPVETEHRHVVEHTIAQVMGLPAIGIPTFLSWFDPNAKILTVHLGGNRALRMSSNSAEFVENGSNNIIFKTPSRFEPIPLELIDLDTDYSGWWKDFWPGMPNLIGMTEAEASALMHVWMIFFFFQSAAVTRPILVWLGNFGAGKSTMGRMLYRLLYGVQMDLIAIRSQNSFDTVMSNHALAIFDNVDSKANWLNEALAMSISRTESDRRKYYTDNDIYVVQNQAMIGVTSRNPPFLQEDIIDRMLYFNLLRFEDLGITLRPESELYTKVTANRHRYLSGLLQECRKVMSTPRPVTSGISWRIADFVDLGYWIASSLGIESDFILGIQKLKKQQRSLTLETDQAIVAALEHYAAKCRDASKWKSISQLWEDFILYSPDDVMRSLEQTYKNPQGFARKLTAILGIIQTIVPLECAFDEDTGFRKWRVVPT